MSKILDPIGERSFETIRNRITEILIDELFRQVAITYDESLDATIYLERYVPLDKTELPAVVVSLAEGDFSNFKQGAKDGTYQFFIDCFVRGASDSTDGGDTRSTKRLHRLMGVCDAILSNPVYKTLGFSPPFISHTEVSSMKIADPRSMKDAENVMMGRLTFSVRAVETTELLVPTIATGYDTQIQVSNSDEGYFWSSSSPVNPKPQVDCEIDVKVKNSLGSIVAFKTVTNLDKTIDLPDTTYNIYVNGNFDQSVTLPSLSNQIINITA